MCNVSACFLGMVILVDFLVFNQALFGEDGGCKSGDRGGKRGGALSVVEVFNGVEMSVGGSGAREVAVEWWRRCWCGWWRK